jgi:dipeptidyl aminopeptidase/acylaminoacyl peptidase
VLIDIHGGPEGQARPGYMGRLNYLVDQLGIAIIEPNVRGSTATARPSSRSTTAASARTRCKDIGALLDWIATQPDLDRQRVRVTAAATAAT